MTERTVQLIFELTVASYEKIAPHFSATRRLPWDDLLPLTKIIRDDMSLLDVGCGNGRLLSIFHEKRIQYIGIDQSEGLIREARKAAERDQGNQLFLKGDILSLETVSALNGKQFDIITLVAILSHIPTRALQLQVLRRLHAVLKHDGVLFMANWNLWRPTLHQKSIWRYALERFKSADREWERQYGFSKEELRFKDVMTLWQSATTFAPLYYYSFTLTELIGLCREAGFAIQDAYYSRKGKRVHWWNGYNSILIIKKETHST